MLHRIRSRLVGNRTQLGNQIRGLLAEYGDKQRLLGISKRGDPYLRMLLIQRARSVVYRCVTKTDSRSRWIADKQRRLGQPKLASLWRIRTRGLSGLSSPRMSLTAAPLEKILFLEIDGTQ